MALHELYPSKEAPDAADGMAGGLSEAFDQLEELIGESSVRP
ncbi:MAG: hypothetical protein PW843_10250 [Azospirillaceae bacterium]|nr:hypothetical protein [Azospirillaceae bacterium]